MTNAVVRRAVLIVFLTSVVTSRAMADVANWTLEWPRTDFSRMAVAEEDVLSGGPPKDGIPSIDKPEFVRADGPHGLSARDPVISLVVGDTARAYPLRVLMWHEIVNDRIGGIPVAVTYCPLCNAALAFERTLGGRSLTFGVTGKLRHSDMIMFDRETESWWQQYSGEGIVGAMMGEKLRQIPVRLEAFELFQRRHPAGEVLIPNDPSARSYGANPYVGYEDSGWPFLYKGAPLTGITALERILVVGDRAWTLDLIKVRRRLAVDGLLIEWIPGQASALDTAEIAEGRDVGSVVVRREENGSLVDVVHQVTFAFVLNAFRPNATIHTLTGDINWGR